MHSADQLRCVLDTLEVRSVDAAEKYTRSVQKKNPPKSKNGWWKVTQEKSKGTPGQSKSVAEEIRYLEFPAAIYILQ